MVKVEGKDQHWLGHNLWVAELPVQTAEKRGQLFVARLKHSNSMSKIETVFNSHKHFTLYKPET